MKPAALMFQGTGSDVGKSLIVAGLCRAFARQGLRVRPFKPQNMSNNAAVTPQGGEIGRAQALQARACGLEPHPDMNPVLLKPQSSVGSQVIVQGEVWGSARAREYYGLKPKLLPKVLDSYTRLGRDADLVLVEGAGSAAEVNLRSGDIANMGFALAAQVPVILIGDIDRGGVIASLVGTCELMEAQERELLAGYLINRFRGDPGLFDSGLEVISQRTGLRGFGVIPFFSPAADLPAEDSVVLDTKRTSDPARGDSIKVAVTAFPRIANFDDCDPLLAEPDVTVEFIRPGKALPGDADLIIIPGSKATIADLEVLKQEGWDVDIHAHVRRGGWVLGLCGGYQMLGREVRDPRRIEGSGTRETGLGWLPVDTELKPNKELHAVQGVHLESGEAVRGYEMHMGDTRGDSGLSPWLRLGSRDEGAVSTDGKVMGSYVHGLFAADGFRHSFLSAIKSRQYSGLRYDVKVESTLDELARHLAEHVDLDLMLETAAKRPAYTATAHAMPSIAARTTPAHR